MNASANSSRGSVHVYKGRPIMKNALQGTKGWTIFDFHTVTGRPVEIDAPTLKAAKQMIDAAERQK